jgi:class 3 adenylate cyclase/tetratricopeptide (TPR) repeat protein
VTRRERKVVTVLFADLAGFTSRAESMDPEDVAALLDPYHGRLKNELERFGGTVEKFIGDAVMAVFGAPLSHEDDAERAVRAALAIRDWASEESIELRVGINTGEALITLDAKPTEGETMAAGDVVNTAARLQSAAPIGEIFVGEQTFQATERAIEFTHAESVQAKGKAQPVAAWQALGARARVSVERVHGAALVGRRRELEMLHGALERSRQERSSELLTLVGVPGIGKSRLVNELYDLIERETEITSWRYGRCLPYGEGVTFWALGEMVKAQAGILEDDDEEETQRKLHAAVDDPWIESHLRALVGLSGGVGGGGGRDEAFTAWRRFFEGIADERPLVLVFEDIHWADENLLDFIDHLVDWASGVPLLVVCTARPELMALRPSWGGGKTNAQTISLSPLSDVETTALLTELLERTLLHADARAELLARAGGNPLYAEEYVRAMRDHGRVEQLPATVQGMIAARLDLLESEEKTLVQNAAVIGKTFWLGALVLSCGEERSQLEQRLHVLERKEFVRRERSSSLTGDVEYSFRHLLFRDVAYGQIPRAERAERHRRAAEWLEGLGRSEDHSEMLAYHYLQALELGAAAGLDTSTFAERAQSALADAGDRAFALNASAAAARHYRGALELLPEDHPSRGRLLLYLGRALRELGEPQLIQVLEQARDAFLAAGDAEAAGETESRLVDAYWIDGDRDAAFAHMQRARELLDPLPSSAVKAHAIVTASRFHMLAAEDEEAIRLGREALAIAEELGLDEVRASALNNIGSSRSNLGDERWRADLEESVRVAEGANTPFELVRAKGNLAANLWALGDLVPAFEIWRDSEAISHRFGQLGFARWFSGVLVSTMYSLGDWEGALAAADQFIADVEAGRPHYLAATVYFTRADIRLARGDSDPALADVEQALTLATRAADPQALLPALAVTAHVCLKVGDRDRAASLATDFLSAIESGKGIGVASSALHELSWTLAAIGRGRELANALDGNTNPWARAAVAFATGDPATAATICAEMGATTDEAYARMSAARMLMGQGRKEEGDEQVRRALAFYRSVEATRYIRECEAIATST